MQHCFGVHVPNLAPSTVDMVVRVVYRNIATIHCADAREDLSTEQVWTGALQSEPISICATNT